LSLSLPISEIGAKLRQAGRLQNRPLCIYGSKTIPDGTIPSTSISRCIAQAIATVAFREKTLGIYAASALRGKRFVYSTEQKAVAVKEPELTKVQISTSHEKLQKRP
jgi:hypothetical protein